MRISMVLPVVSLLVLLALQTAAVELNYIINVSNPETSMANVTIEIYGLESNEKLNFRMQKYDWYTRSKILGDIECSNCVVYTIGNIVEIKPLSSMGVVQITYKVINRARDPHGDYESYLDENFGVLDGRFLFLKPVESEINSVNVSFYLPSGWKIAHVWDENPTVEQLDNFIAVGPLEVTEYSFGKTKIKIARFTDNERKNFSKLPEIINKIIEFYVNKAFGGEPESNLLIILAKSPIEGGGVRKHSIMVSREYTHFKIFSILSHELCHIWNGKSIRYETPSTYWFNEGGTEYISKLALINSGVLSEDYYKQILYRKWIRYKETIVDKGKDKPVSSVREYGSDDYLIYHKGELVAYLLDNEIKKRTEGKKSILDVMRYLYENDRVIEGNEDILKAVEAVTGSNFANFFENYVYGAKPIELRFKETPKPTFATPEPTRNVARTPIQYTTNVSSSKTAGDAEVPKTLIPGFETTSVIVGLVFVTYIFYVRRK